MGKDIDNLERVQRRTTRLISEISHPRLHAREVDGNPVKSCYTIDKVQ